MIRVLLVDDEAPARSRLRRLLGDHDDFEVVGEAADGPEALERVASLEPDVVFLDIQMPGATGLEVARTLTPPRPHVVFCTAYDQHAIDAFELHAIDYLMKPASRQRLDKALERLRQRVAEERDASDAAATQRRLLPREAPRLKRLSLAAHSEPARQVGGDYYDFLALESDVCGLIVGDVAGKGMDAGLLMAGLQARLQTVAPQHGAAIEETLTEVNRSLEPMTSDARYVTLFAGAFDDRDGTLRYVNAGHNPPLLLRAGDAEPVALEATGTVVGLLADTRYEARRIEIRAGDLWVGYSDGLSEATSPDGVEFGMDRLADAMRQIPGDADATTSRDAILSVWTEFRNGAAPDDDVTLVVARGVA